MDAADAGHRRDEDDRAPATLLHERHRRPAKVIDGVDVDVEGRVPRLGRDLEAARPAPAPPAQWTSTSTEPSAAAASATHRVASSGLPMSATTITRPGRPRASIWACVGAGLVVVVAADDGHVGPAAGQLDGRCRADPFGAAGDQGCFSVKIHDDSYTPGKPRRSGTSPAAKR